MFDAVGDFKMKRKLFQKQMENVNLCHSASCGLLHKDRSVSVLFISVLAVDMIAP
jgi:hypothetical protein